MFTIIMAVEVKLKLLYRFLLLFLCYGSVSTVSNSYSSMLSVSSLGSSIVFSSITVLQATSSSLLPSPSPMPDEAPTINITLLSSIATDCSCNYVLNSCDLNCCCDSDCTADEIKVFAQCLNIQDSSTSKFCINGYDIFRSSLTNSRLSDLFCVYTDNYPGRREFSSIDTVSSLSEAGDNIIKFGSTASLVSAIPSFEPFRSEYYRSGDPIDIMYNNNDAVGYLPLPATLNGVSCHDGNPITYLNDKTSTCTRYLSSNGQECTVLSPLNARVFYQNFSVFPFPISADNDNATMIPVDLDNWNCRDLNDEEVSCGSIDPPIFDQSSLTCNNTLLSLSYVIVHNGTQGLISVSANVVVGIATLGYITQSFSVEFDYFNTNETDSVDFIRPGNPGYIQSQPILGGNQVNDIVNVSGNSDHWFTVPLGDNNGLCQGERESILFRDDHRTSCILKISVDDIVLRGCDNLGTLSILLGQQPYTDRLGIYGNADVNDLSQWIGILGLDGESIPVQSQCSNVITGVQIIVFYSYTGDINSPQAVVTGSQIKYLTQNIKPQCSMSVCSLDSPNIPIVLETIVTFIPVYKPPDEVLLTATLTTRRLPQDFLYPLFTGNGSCSVTGAIVLTILSLLISSTWT